MSLQQETGSISGPRIQNPLGVAAMDALIPNAEVGDARLNVPITKDDHVLVESVERFYCVISWAYGQATARARVRRTLVQLPDNYLAQG